MRFKKIYYIKDNRLFLAYFVISIAFIRIPRHNGPAIIDFRGLVFNWETKDSLCSMDYAGQYASHPDRIIWRNMQDKEEYLKYDL